MNKQLNFDQEVSINMVKQALGKRYRRSKFDDIQRDFMCQCGKSYLSYPALYTHYKNKHENSNRSAKKQAAHKQQSDQYQSNKQKNIIKQAQSFNILTINQINQLLDEQGHTTDDTISQQSSLGLCKIIEYWENRRKQELQYQNQVYLASIDQAFGLFLFEQQKYLTQPSYAFFRKLIASMRAGLNQLKKDQQYCEIAGANKLPWHMNELYCEILQKIYCTQMNSQSNNRTLVCLAIYHFNRWLLREELTNLNLRLNID